MHQESHLLHALRSRIAHSGALFHHLVQQAHQSGQIDANSILEIGLGLCQIGAAQTEDIGGGLMELLVERLQLPAELVDLLVICGKLGVIEPLAQDALGVVGAAGKLGVGVEGVAEVCGPLVVGGLRVLALIQQLVGPGGGRLRVLDRKSVV